MANVLFPYGAVEGFGYNNDYTLFAVGGWSGSSQFYSRIYTRDAAGRVTQVTNPQTPAPTPTPMVTIPAVSSASYLVNNQLSKWNGTSVTEDANGNLLSDGLGNSFVWNERNQLATLETPNVKELLQYDAFGRQFETPSGGDQLRNLLLYDGLNVRDRGWVVLPVRVGSLHISPAAAAAGPSDRYASRAATCCWHRKTNLAGNLGYRHLAGRGVAAWVAARRRKRA